jgi:photosystem II stability/assembly factor-like uncharacterized protein
VIKKISFPLLLGIIILSLTGCVTAGVPKAGTSVPTSLPPTQAVSVISTPIPPTLAPSPTYTPLPPTETPTAVPPTPTATPLPVNAIQHFPSRQAFTVTAIRMVDATTGWAIGGLGNVGDHVLFTTDGGSTWMDVTPPQPVAANDVQQFATGFFQDAKTAWVTYGINGGNPVPTQSVVWRTSDGGLSWQASQPLDLTDLTEIYVPSNLQFVNGQTGWLLVHVGVGMNHDYIAIYRSMDAGASWSRIQDPYNDTSLIMSCSKNTMLFTDATHGWLTGDCYGVMAGVLLYKSIDAGSTWQAVTLPAPTSAPGLFDNNSSFACGGYDPFFFGNDLGHLSVRCANYRNQPATYSYYIFTTQNGGSAWTSATYPGEALYFFSADTGWALSTKIQLTTDGGKTWKAISDVTWTAGMDFISEQIGWVVATAGDLVALVKTDNAGVHWTKLTPVVGP